MHMSRPPATELFSGRPFPQCWVAVNEGGAAPGVNKYAGPCDANSGFAIPGVPPGNYELKVFDAPLDVVIATLPFTVDPGGAPERRATAAATSARCRCSTGSTA